MKILSGISIIIASIVLLSASAHADDFSYSGRFSVRGIEPLDPDSAQEDPSVSGRIKMDSAGPKSRLHVWLEGGFDGTVHRPKYEAPLFKVFDAVYQDYTPYLELKELYAEFSVKQLDLKAGIQRFAWGRLDEYPPNDLFNPWDYTQFLRKPLEDRKIGVPSLAAGMNPGAWTIEAVWVPLHVPYRFPMPDERWSGMPALQRLADLPDVHIVPHGPERTIRSLENSSEGLRIKRTGDIELAVNLFHGYDPRPVFKTTSLIIKPINEGFEVDPGYVPSFHKITVIGMDAAAVSGDFSVRAEAAYAKNRYFNVRSELWGYPAVLIPGVSFPLQPNMIRSDVLDYGVGADYRLMEDVWLIIQAQQTLIFDRTDALYEKKLETVLWANVKANWMNQKLETNASIAYNPEHASHMAKATAYYTFSDSWKGGATAIAFSGPEQSLFGRYDLNDQIEAEVVYSW